MKPAIPNGFREVTKEEFFDLLKADPRDIMPSQTCPTFTTWEIVMSRSTWGWSAPGWKNVGQHEPIYAVKN